MSEASSNVIPGRSDDSLKMHVKRKARDSDSDTESGSDDSLSSNGARSNGSDGSRADSDRVRKSSKKEKKRSKKSSKKKKKKSDKKKKKHKKDKQRYSEAELKNQRAIDELDQEAKEFAASIGGSSKLSDREQASLLHSDFQSRAMSLGLPKGLIRTTGVSGSSGLFSAGGRFGDKVTHQQLAGGFGEDENPAAAARRKREQRAQQAEARAREILLERAASAGDGTTTTASGFTSLKSRFGASSVQKSFM